MTVRCEICQKETEVLYTRTVLHHGRSLVVCDTHLWEQEKPKPKEAA